MILASIVGTIVGLLIYLGVITLYVNCRRWYRAMRQGALRYESCRFFSRTKRFAAEGCQGDGHHLCRQCKSFEVAPIGGEGE